MDIVICICKVITTIIVIIIAIGLLHKNKKDKQDIENRKKTELEFLTVDQYNSFLYYMKRDAYKGRKFDKYQKKYCPKEYVQGGLIDLQSISFYLSIDHYSLLNVWKLMNFKVGKDYNIVFGSIYITPAAFSRIYEYVNHGISIGTIYKTELRWVKGLLNNRDSFIIYDMSEFDKNLVD